MGGDRAEELALRLAILAAVDEREPALGAVAAGSAVPPALLLDLVGRELSHAEAEHRRLGPRRARLGQVRLDEPLRRRRRRRDDLGAKELAQLGVRVEVARVDHEQVPAATRGVESVLKRRGRCDERI